MVREVEFSNFLELLNDDMPYSDGDDQRMFDGVLRDSANTLDVKVAKAIPVAGVGARKLYLYFGNTDFDNNMVDYVSIGETDLDWDVSNERYNREYTFDLSKVLNIPRKVYNTKGTSEIVVELYTYEANVTTDYGTKRLSVPYSITSDARYNYDNSTDGVYRMVMVDFADWSSGITYDIGDIVHKDNAIMVSTVNNNSGVNPSLSALWATPTEAQISDFIYGITTNPPLNSVISDMLVSRYAKYNYILEAIKKTWFKEYDDLDAMQNATLLQMLRERSLINLLEHKPIHAAYGLQQLKLAYSNIADTNKVRTQHIKYTL